MKKIILLMALICQITVVAQDYRFGKVSKEEIEEKFYPQDSTADAAYLYRERNSYYILNSNQDGFDIITDVFLRIKIYNKKGFDKATQIIPYYHPEIGEDEKISSLKAYTFNLQKNKIEKDKLQNNDVFQEEISKFWYQKKITMPNVKEGSVIDIKYTLSSPYYYKIDDLDFQFDVPVKKIIYNVSIPEFYIFKLLTKGYFPITPKSSRNSSSITITSRERSGARISSTAFSSDKLEFDVQNYLFESENIPALKDNEPFVSNINNYRGGVKFELSSTNFSKIGGLSKYYSNTWEDVSKQIYKSEGFGNELDKTNYYKDDLETLLVGVSNNAEKIAKIFTFVKTKIKWNSYFGKTSDIGLKKAYKDGAGNAADINLMLTSMLRYAGLNADPVLVSTRSNGVPIYPTLDGFNYVIASVEMANGGILLLDATEIYSTPNILPVRVLNWNGRRVTKDGNSSWVKLTSSRHAVEENMMMVKVSDDLMVEGFIRTKFENLNALDFRKNYNHIKEEELIKNYEENNNLETEEFKISNQEDIYKDIVRNVKFSSEDLIEKIGNKLYIEPNLFLTKRENPFKLDERKFPIDFVSAWKNENKITIQIPKGYAVESLPESLAIALPDNLGVFKYQVTHNGNKIKTISSLEFNMSIIPPQYYSFLKDFYGKIVDKQTEKIVLIKS
ncbi:DUF3857 domain-containing protein [Polaribacter sp. Hel_I_88]|uniref:transglutaminase domain-containing protein n=1 Tax=Polaribacter sp. Hel_I_88 TaxID=1250006 RepID=UPI00047B7D4E|nr:DUF3857 domain-containing protein [Polaribacter sp. Hel_I_88]